MSGKPCRPIPAGVTPATGVRTEVIVGPTGTRHAPKRTPWGDYVRRLDWRLTLCGQIAEHGWTQRRVYGYVDCRSCIRLLEHRPVNEALA